MNEEQYIEKISMSTILGGTRITIARTDMDQIGFCDISKLHY